MKVLVVCTVPFEINGIVNVIMNYYTNMKCDSVKFDFIAHTNIVKIMEIKFLYCQIARKMCMVISDNCKGF